MLHHSPSKAQSGTVLGNPGLILAVTPERAPLERPNIMKELAAPCKMVRPQSCIPTSRTTQLALGVVDSEVSQPGDGNLFGTRKYTYCVAPRRVVSADGRTRRSGAQCIQGAFASFLRKKRRQVQAVLPSGFRCVSENYDNVLDHRLWKDEGERSPSPDASSNNKYSLFRKPPLAPGSQPLATIAGATSTARPLSGDLLTRHYQTKAIKRPNTASVAEYRRVGSIGDFSPLGPKQHRPVTAALSSFQNGVVERKDSWSAQGSSSPTASPRAASDMVHPDAAAMAARVSQASINMIAHAQDVLADAKTFLSYAANPDAKARLEAIEEHAAQQQQQQNEDSSPLVAASPSPIGARKSPTETASLCIRSGKDGSRRGSSMLMSSTFGTLFQTQTYFTETTCLQLADEMLMASGEHKISNPMEGVLAHCATMPPQPSGSSPPQEDEDDFLQDDDLWNFEVKSVKENCRSEVRTDDLQRSVIHAPLGNSTRRASIVLRSKIAHLESLAPVVCPEIRVEFVGSPQSTGSQKHLKEFAEPRMARRRSSFASYIQSGYTLESKTCFPPQDLHLYQLYCINTKSIMVFRPVSPAVPSMYAGNSFIPQEFCDSEGIPLTMNEIDPDLTMEDIQAITTRNCRVKGKGINISLKSSPYPPIEGLIPINPNLSKTYSEARKKQRLLEDQLLGTSATQHARLTVFLAKKLQHQKDYFGSNTLVAIKEIENKLAASDHKLADLWDKYKGESMLCTDKLSVSCKYLDELNDSQFLGKTVAQWRGMDLYFQQGDDGDLERSATSGAPLIFAKRGDSMFRYDPVTNELLPQAVGKLSQMPSMQPIYVLTHKSFVISELSHRIEPDPDGDFIIAPDFDGLCYCAQLPHMKFYEYAKFCETRLVMAYVPSMGIVNEADVKHVLDMRRMTQWKQNHGYECSNTIKTQELGTGDYVAVTPDDVRLLNNFEDIIDFYRMAWTEGYPLLLNPNWKVVLGEDHLPTVYGDEHALPVIDDCGMSIISAKIEEYGKSSIETVKAEAAEYEKESIAASKQQEATGRRRIPPNCSSRLVQEMALVLGKKHLAEAFYAYRRWLLVPPLFEKLERNKLFRNLQQDIAVSSEFEDYRTYKLTECDRDFERACVNFQRAFPEDQGRFVARLKAFTSPNLSPVQRTELRRPQSSDFLSVGFIDSVEGLPSEQAF